MKATFIGTLGAQLNWLKVRIYLNKALLLWATQSRTSTRDVSLVHLEADKDVCQKFNFYLLDFAKAFILILF